MTVRNAPSGGAANTYPLQREVLNLSPMAQVITSGTLVDVNGAELFLNDIRENQQVSAELFTTAQASGAGVEMDFTVQAEWLDADGAVLSTSAVAQYLNSDASGGAQRNAITATGVATVPADAVRCRLYVQASTNGSSPAIVLGSGGTSNSFRLVGEVYSAANGVAVAENDNS